jgi:hypothetical protein
MPISSGSHAATIGNQRTKGHGTQVSLQASNQTAPGIPTGYASLQEINRPAQDAILSSSLVSAISVRTKWPNLEPTEGVFNWAFLDSEIRRAATAKKAVILRVASGGVAVPQWVYERGAQSFAYTDQNPYHPAFGRTITMAIPWDPVMLRYKKELIQTLGARYANNPAVQVIGEACGNSNTEDWHLPDSPVDLANWARAGYTHDKLITAGQEIIDTAMAAFPNQSLLMSFNSSRLDRIAPTAGPNYAQSTIIAYARKRYGSRFIVEKNSLCARTPHADTVRPDSIMYTLKQAGPPIALQMLWWVTGDPTYRMGRPTNRMQWNAPGTIYDPVRALQTSIAIGLEYGTAFQEIYAVDLLNPRLRPMLVEMRDKFR